MMRRLLAPLIASLLCGEAVGAVAFDASSCVSAGTGTLSWTHTPVGTPAGVIVLIMQADVTADEISAGTYGGSALSHVASSPYSVNQATDDSVLAAMFLGSSIPTGAQTVEITVSGSANKKACAITVTATADTQIQNTAVAQGTGVEDPAVSLALSGISSYVASVIMSGQNTAPTATPAGWTEIAAVDMGTEGIYIFSYDTVGTTDVSVTIDRTGATADYGLFGVAIRESAGGASIPAIYSVLRNQKR